VKPTWLNPVQERKEEFEAGGNYFTISKQMANKGQCQVNRYSVCQEIFFLTLHANTPHRKSAEVK
jgi:hypothetical protein